ncbi:MAG TPA: formylglycine-generating enzyme family protein [Enhygromyxa sp.]|nr:formylglycine-generating enzyme family protein [Enhygromyxa sp.]
MSERPGLIALLACTVGCGPGLVSASGESDTSTSTSTEAETESTSETGDPDPFVYELVEVPGGWFVMGCAEGLDPFCEPWEFPPHEVLLEDFSIGKYEVTVAEYRACVEAGSCETPGSCHWTTPGYEQHPINCVSWSQAVDFCEWIGGRLPSEAEWEKAARSDDARVYPWGNDPLTCERVVSSDLCNSNGAEPVGSRPAGASPYGALDMLGNLQEWVSDWYADDYYAVSEPVNPLGPSDPTCCKVTRGGQVGYVPEVFRCSYRNWFGVEEWNGNQIGFRCVVE